MSAIQENTDGPIDVIQVLFVLHPSFGAQELCGPLEVLSSARHKINDPGNPHILFTQHHNLGLIVDSLACHNTLADILRCQKPKPSNVPLRQLHKA